MRTDEVIQTYPRIINMTCVRGMGSFFFFYMLMGNRIQQPLSKTRCTVMDLYKEKGQSQNHKDALIATTK